MHKYLLSLLFLIGSLFSMVAQNEALDRKMRSHAYCESYKIPVNLNLPVIETEAATTIRTQEAIVSRALALYFIGIKSEGVEQEALDHLEEKYSIKSDFSPEELAYVNSSAPSQQQTINANWRYESLHVFLWALGYIDSLSYPSELCNVYDDTGIIWEKSRQEFMAQAKLRSKAEMLDQADLIYRIHWACTEARIKGQPAPAGLNSSVVYERHYALNWLIRYMDQDWDEVTTDT